ncbi:MAG TPA: DUF1285 domain-containing protein [Hyphomicrobium sp.]|jgi:hypothetical protein
MDRTEADEGRQCGPLAGPSRRTGTRSLPPVERWHPAHCGDIGLAIRSDGTWLYRGSPIRREALVRLFASVLRKDADGRTYLVTPAEKVDVAVEDAPFLAVEMEVLGTARAQQLILRTNVDDMVRCGPEHPLRFAHAAPGGGLKPYVLVRGRLEALFTRSLVYELAGLMVEEVREGRTVAGVWSGGAFFPIVSAP